MDEYNRQLLQKLCEQDLDDFMAEVKDWAKNAVQLEDYGDGYGVWGLPKEESDD